MDSFLFVSGQSCNCLSGKPNNGSTKLQWQQTHRDFQNPSFPKVEEDDFEPVSEDFHGFLTIGTLGSEPQISNPPTPTFGNSAKNSEVVVTENNYVKVLNEEMEEVLARKSLDQCDFEGTESAVELQGKDKRPSLGELFEKSKMGEGNWGGESGKVEKKGVEKSSVQHLMRKILKKKVNSKTCVPTTDDYTSVDKKVPKIMHMFHKKIHPEGLAARKTTKKNKDMRCTSNDRDQHGEKSVIIPQRTLTRKIAHFNPPDSTPFGQENMAYWIKTDANYLVLEL